MPTETATTITMPQLGESVTEGTVGTWLKQVGDPVEKYEPLVEVETDKVNTEIPSPVAGVLVEILIDPNTTVPVGTPLCRIDDGAHAAAAAAATATNGARSRPDAVSEQIPPRPSIAEIRRKGEIADEMALLRARSSPVVRRIAEEDGIDLSQIEGTGIGGRVTKQDVLDYVARQTAAPAPVPVTPAQEPVAARPAEPAPGPEPRRAPLPVHPGDEVIPVSPLRRQVAEHMVRSERTAPQATVVMEVDMTDVVAYRAARKDAFQAREGIELTYLPFAIKAVTLALRDYPRLNAAWDEDRIIHRHDINIGIAVALEDGLVVPVIKHADRLSITGLMHAIADLAGKARAGTLAPDDVSGGTFTVNNPGTFGSLHSTPILVHPQAAILSTEAIVKRPVVIDDMIAIRSMMNLSLTIDHRVLDGLMATRFLQAVRRWLEEVDDHSSLL